MLEEIGLEMHCMCLYAFSMDVDGDGNATCLSWARSCSFQSDRDTLGFIKCFEMSPSQCILYLSQSERRVLGEANLVVLSRRNIEKQTGNVTECKKWRLLAEDQDTISILNCNSPLRIQGGGNMEMLDRSCSAGGNLVSPWI
jgi:hypothetical protein